MVLLPIVLFVVLLSYIYILATLWTNSNAVQISLEVIEQ